FVLLRRHFLIRDNPGIHAKTVMVTGLPHELRQDSGKSLREFFENLGIGKVRNAQVMPNVKQLELALKRRADVLRTLERTYIQWEVNRRRAERRYQSTHQMSGGEAAALIRTASTSSRPMIYIHCGQPTSLSWYERLMAILGGDMETINAEMMDAVDFYTTQLVECNNTVKTLRRGPFSYTGTGFVTFETQSSANIA